MCHDTITHNIYIGILNMHCEILTYENNFFNVCTGDKLIGYVRCPSVDTNFFTFKDLTSFSALITSNVLHPTGLAQICPVAGMVQWPNQYFQKSIFQFPLNSITQLSLYKDTNLASLSPITLKLMPVTV